MPAIGRPSLVNNPAVVADVITRSAAGQTIQQTGEAANVSHATVSRVRRTHADRIDRARKRAEIIQITKVLAEMEAMTHSRCTDAKNDESKTGAQSYRAVCEVAQMVGKGPTFIGGDVNVTVLDSSQHVHLANADSDELQQRLDALSAQLGT